MNILRNPFVVGGLVLVAVAVVVFQVLPRRPGAQASRPLLAAPLAPAPAVTSATLAERTPPASNSAPPELPMDTNFLQTHFGSAAGAPQRDPFQAQTQGWAEGAATNAPQLKLTLKAIWRQTGSRLAAINNGIYREGQEIAQGYTVEKIEDDRVWMQEPSGRESLSFTNLQPAVAAPEGTNRANH